MADKAYVFINDRVEHYPIIKSKVGGGAKFDKLNSYIRNTMVMPGQLIVVGDESTPEIGLDEHEMVRLAYGTHHSLFQHLAGWDGQIVNNYDLLQNLLGYSALGIGATSDAWAKHLKGVEKTLEDIERLYQLSLKRGTPMARQEFINQRRIFFAKLDTQLGGIARWGTGMHNEGSIKKMLGVSTRSYLHTQELRGYTDRLSHITEVSRLLKAGTPIGIGLTGLASYLEINEACSTGREDMCAKAKYIEGSKLALGLAGGYLAGGVGATAATAICVVVFGIPSFGVGAIGCGIMGGVLAGYTGGTMGEMAGEQAGQMLYEWRP